MVNRRVHKNTPGTPEVLGFQKSFLDVQARRKKLLRRKRFAVRKHTAPESSLRHEFCSYDTTIKSDTGNCNKTGIIEDKLSGEEREGDGENGKLMKLQPLGRQIL